MHRPRMSRNWLYFQLKSPFNFCRFYCNSSCHVPRHWSVSEPFLTGSSWKVVPFRGGRGEAKGCILPQIISLELFKAVVEWQNQSNHNKPRRTTTRSKNKETALNARKRQGPIGGWFCFTSDLIRSGVEFAGLFREQNNTNNKANADFYRHSTEK